MVLAMSTLAKILLGIAVISAQALDINATQHTLRPPYDGRENEFLAHPFVHEGGFAEQWGATLASDAIQWAITRRWSSDEQAAAWSARAAAHLNAALQANATIRAHDAATAAQSSASSAH